MVSVKAGLEALLSNTGPVLVLQVTHRRVDNALHEHGDMTS